jgi:hypothetical protein
VGCTALNVKFLAGERAALVTIGAREIPFHESLDLIARAANFRIEADLLRERACVSFEPVVRERYLALAERWLMFAAGLEAEALTAQTTLL